MQNKPSKFCPNSYDKTKKLVKKSRFYALALSDSKAKVKIFFPWFVFP